MFLGLARLRGMECRARYAEAFTLHEISHLDGTSARRRALASIFRAPSRVGGVTVT